MSIENFYEKSNMIYTPIYKIPIGEPVVLSDGSYGIRVKKPNNSKQEVVSLSLLMTLVIKKVNSEQSSDQ